MKRHIASSLIACAISAATVHGQSSGDTNKPAAAPPPSMGLKDAYAGKFLIGTAGDVPGRYSEAELANIKANYNIITPENSMKPQPTHPSEDTYNFTTPDALVKWCGENNIKVWGHTLAWHAQTAPWFFQPGTNGQPVTRELAMERLSNHIHTVVGRYKGRVMGWDVVNEAINDRGGGETENLRNSSWVRAIGPDYLTLAFKWAHEADPDAQLYYNDYNIDQDTNYDRATPQYSGKHTSSMLLLKRLIKDGAPINGVGIQGHWHLYNNIPDVEKAIADYESLGLKVSISELDVTATGENSGAFPTRGGGAPITPEAFQKQAEVYAKLFDVFNRHAKSISRVTFWGISDRRSWRSGQRPLVFDGQLQPKPALQAILDVGLGKKVTTQP
jgi:endo-1,4-beta-xylanase